jgi:hypothetical protein
MSNGWRLRIQALLTSVDDTSMEKVMSCDIQKLVKSLKLKKACGLDGTPNECLRHLLRRPLVHLTHLFNCCFWLSYFPKPWQEVITLLKPSKDPKFPQNLCPISLLSTTENFSKNSFSNYSKNILKKEASSTQANLASVHVTAHHCNV